MVFPCSAKTWKISSPSQNWLEWTGVCMAFAKHELSRRSIWCTMPHISLTSVELDPSLMEITTRAENLRRRYFHRNLFGNDDQFCEPVYVTKKKRTERNLISNKSKSETYDIISTLLDKCLVNAELRWLIASRTSFFNEPTSQYGVSITKVKLINWQELVGHISL